MTRESEVSSATSSSTNPSSGNGLPNLCLASGEVIDAGRTIQHQQRLANSASGNGKSIRRPGSLGSRSASDSEEERPDSSLESNEIRIAEDERLGLLLFRASLRKQTRQFTNRIVVYFGDRWTTGIRFRFQSGTERRSPAGPRIRAVTSANA